MTRVFDNPWEPLWFGLVGFCFVGPFAWADVAEPWVVWPIAYFSAWLGSMVRKP